MHLLFSQLALGCMYILALCCWLGCAHARWDTIGDTLSKAGDVLGPIGDALGIVSFLMDDEIWEADTVGGTQVAIGVNREGDKQDDFYGKIRIIWAFDVFNNVLGSSDLDIKIDDSGKLDSTGITIHQVMGEGAQAAFLDIIASDDEICITHVVAHYPSGGETWGWTGDIGAACGQAWHYGTRQHGTTKSGDPYFPKCTWMDTDGGVDIDKDPVSITNRQMKINIMAYGGAAADKGLDYYCGATIFTHDNADPIAGMPPQGPVCPGCTRKKRRLEPDHSEPSTNTTFAEQKLPRPRSARSASELIVNSRPQQSAIRLCRSPTSRGSDFASTDEGIFCDMEAKTLYPLCSGEIQAGCFDLQADELQLRKRDGPGLFSRDTPVKKYKSISYWD